MGNFLADFYSVNGLVLESRKRREHLSEEDILRNKAIMESLSKGGTLIEQNLEVSRALNRADRHFSREKAIPSENLIYSPNHHFWFLGAMKHHATDISIIYDILKEKMLFEFDGLNSD